MLNPMATRSIPVRLGSNRMSRRSSPKGSRHPPLPQTKNRPPGPTSIYCAVGMWFLYCLCPFISPWHARGEDDASSQGCSCLFSRMLPTGGSGRAGCMSVDVSAQRRSGIRTPSHAARARPHGRPAGDRAENDHDPPTGRTRRRTLGSEGSADAESSTCIRTRLCRHPRSSAQASSGGSGGYLWTPRRPR